MEIRQFNKRNLSSSPGWSGLVAVVIVLIWVAMSVAAGPTFVAAFFVKGKVGLKWRKIEGVESYSIYRKAQGGEFEKISSTGDDHYFDTDLVAGTVYIYRLGVASADGLEEFSAEKSVTIPGVEAGDFQPPIWVGLRVDQDRIYLNWDPVPSAIAYNIMRSATPGGEYETIGNAQSSKYADKTGLEKGRTYYYVLTALNADFEETKFSEERSIKYGISLAEQEKLEAEQTKIVLEDVKLTELFDITTAGNLGAMNQPADVFVNSVGRIYITDALNAKVHCFAPDGKYLFSFGERMDKGDIDNPPPGTFLIPFTLFIDKQDQVFVTDIDGHDIQVFTADGKFIKRIRVQTGDNQATLRPNGIHVLDDGRMVITDTGNHRFLIIDQNGRILLSVGERGSKPGQFAFPDELTVTDDNIICIVDVINCRIQEFDLDGKFIRTFGSVGQSAGTFARPKAITIDERGRIWVSDGMSSVIQCFTVDGKVKSALGTMNDESVKFVTPRGIFFKDGRFYVVNRVPNRVVVYQVEWSDSDAE